MRQAIFRICLLGSAGLIALSFGVFESLIMFLLAGIVPGTHYVLSPQQMGIILALVLVGLVFYINHRRVQNLLKRSYTTLDQRLPKRRFREI